MDDSAGPTGTIILFFVLLILNMMFYAFGAAILSINVKEVERRASEEKDHKSKKLLELFEHIEKYVNTVQVVVTLIHLIMGVFFLHAWNKFFEQVLHGEHSVFKEILNNVPVGVANGIVLFISAFLLLFVLLTVGTLLPKKIASKNPESVAYAFIGPVRFFIKVLSPLTGLISASVSAILAVFHIGNNGVNVDVTEEEIIDMVNEGHEQGLLEASEAEMINNIFEFGEKEAKDIMTHVHNITAIDQSKTLQEAIQFMLSENNSRYPVYEENIDHIVGILNLKDAMRMQYLNMDVNTPIIAIPDLIREAVFIPETLNIDTIFQKMQTNKVQMMMVVDEYGQTVGLVTMEDILEEIVGNIFDEYDEKEEHIEEKGKDVFEIEGKATLEELEDRFGITFDDENFETLNGFLISRMDKIPDEDEEYEMDYQGYHLRILSVKNRMIENVEFTKLATCAQ